MRRLMIARPTTCTTRVTTVSGRAQAQLPFQLRASYIAKPPRILLSLREPRRRRRHARPEGIETVENGAGEMERANGFEPSTCTLAKHGANASKCRNRMRKLVPIASANPTKSCQGAQLHLRQRAWLGAAGKRQLPLHPPPRP